MRKILLVTLMVATGMASAQVPHLFADGQKTSADDMNENFSHLITELERVESSSTLDFAVDSNVYYKQDVMEYANGSGVYEASSNIGYGFSTFVLSCGAQEYLAPMLLKNESVDWTIDPAASIEMLDYAGEFDKTHILVDLDSSTQVPLQITTFTSNTPELMQGAFSLNPQTKMVVKADLGECGILSYNDSIIIDDGDSDNDRYHFTQADFELFIGQFRRIH